MLKKFIERMRINRNFSEITVKNYTRTLSTFNEFLNKATFGNISIDTPEKIQLYHINNFILIERTKGQTVATTNNKLAGIKMFIRYCIVAGLEVINPQSIIFARENEIKIEALTKAEATKLMEYFKQVPCETEREELIKIRNLLICSFFLYTGLRVSELSHLQIEEVKDDFQIIGKGWKRRYVHLSTETKAIFDLYITMRKDQEKRLFISHSNNCNGRLSNVSIERIIKRGGEQAGIIGKVFPHKLRHTFATELMKNDVDLIKVQRLLGHKNIQTTERYITVYNKDLKDAVWLINFW